MANKTKQIAVNPDTFKRFLFARARANAATKRANQLRDLLNLPEADKKTAGEYILIDGNAVPVGKLTITARDGYEVKAGWTARLS